VQVVLLMLPPITTVSSFFHVSSEDADSLRSHTLSEAGDIESLERMIDDSDIEQGTPPSS
jgi:hypothetical protein